MPLLAENAPKNLKIALIGNKTDIDYNRNVFTKPVREFCANNKLEFLEISVI